ncbi:hypothetical protein IGI04_024909 [Brassica rapa subsp. trilocularis]|uniref:Uncharacterized protein n=1 Tax=Brassica rapa subsp. trilocularis TaxID=1813537 RepID=A0ABQ7MAG6_BRACM|nr:hypothetical protein IGI04_024909 [Brassica rapa subsp. trilocularis]
MVKRFNQSGDQMFDSLLPCLHLTLFEGFSSSSSHVPVFLRDDDDDDAFELTYSSLLPLFRLSSSDLYIFSSNNIWLT